ncbi:hypothetical protein D1007_29607 [Hordeum vulgare]|nr:hypothetical protein D1007_29607 [Hordeum vulgare]
MLGMRWWKRWILMVATGTGARAGGTGTGGRTRITMAVGGGTRIRTKIRMRAGGTRMIPSIGTGIGRGKATWITASTGTGIQSVTVVVTVIARRTGKGIQRGSGKRKRNGGIETRTGAVTEKRTRRRIGNGRSRGERTVEKMQICLRVMRETRRRELTSQESLTRPLQMPSGTSLRDNMRERLGGPEHEGGNKPK